MIHYHSKNFALVSPTVQFWLQPGSVAEENFSILCSNLMQFTVAIWSLFHNPPEHSLILLSTEHLCYMGKYGK